MTAAHNQVTQMAKNIRTYELYPAGNTEFTEYDDDGISEAYRNGQYDDSYPFDAGRGRPESQCGTFARSF